MLKRQGGACCVFGCCETRNLIEEHSTPHTWTGALPDQLMCKAHHHEKTFGSPGRVGGDIRDIHHTRRIAEKRTQYDDRKKNGPKLFGGGFKGWRDFAGNLVRKNNGR